MHTEHIGSGERSMAENEEAIKTAEQKLEELKSKNPDEVTQKEIQDQIALIRRLRKDQGSINDAGM